MHDTIGFDLVGMVVDDIVVVGAKPLFMTDYIACGKVVPERIAGIVRGIAAACEVAGTALVGGETAEHPGLLGEDEYDVAGAATGVVEADALLGPDRVREGDVLVGMASSGLHSNGYSLVRAVLKHAGWGLERHVDELGRTVGEELLTPTRVYASDCLAWPPTTRPRSTRSRTSRAAAWPRTSRASSRQGSSGSWTGELGRAARLPPRARARRGAARRPREHPQPRRRDGRGRGRGRRRRRPGAVRRARRARVGARHGRGLRPGRGPRPRRRRPGRRHQGRQAGAVRLVGDYRS